MFIRALAPAALQAVRGGVGFAFEAPRPLCRRSASGPPPLFLRSPPFAARRRPPPSRSPGRRPLDRRRRFFLSLPPRLYVRYPLSPLFITV